MPTNEITTAITAAPPITQTLKTRVMAITPMFSPQVVFGVAPARPDSTLDHEQGGCRIDLEQEGDEHRGAEHGAEMLDAQRQRARERHALVDQDGAGHHRGV